MALLFLVCLVIGLVYYGRQILRLLVPQAESSAALAKKIGLFLYTGGFILVCFIILFVLIGLVNEFNTPYGFLVTSLWLLMALEWMIHTIFLTIFSGGSLSRIKNGIIWAWKGKDRKGNSPMDIEVVKDDSNTTITPTNTANTTTNTPNKSDGERKSSSSGSNIVICDDSVELSVENNTSI